MHAHGWILPDQLSASGRGMSVAHPPHPDLVLLCGGTEQQRATLRRAHSATTHSRTAVTTSDVHSLLRWAPRSRAVIVCGELAGIGAVTIEQIVREHAPGVPVLTDTKTRVDGGRNAGTSREPRTAWDRRGTEHPVEASARARRAVLSEHLT